MLLTATILLLSIFGLSRAQIFDITTYGAVGDGSTMNTAAIQAAIDACNNAGGGTVQVPPGNFLTATVFMKDNVTISIDSGATITGSPNISDYPDITPGILSYTDHYTQRSVFYAEGKHNIGITGKGTFQGNGISISFLSNSGNRPYGFRFISCTNVRYEGLTMLNSGFWMMHNQNIDTLLIKNIRIVNQNLGNGDGISIDGCKNVVVDSCTADCNDDPIVIKTTSLSAAENISISNCTVMSYSRAIKIGTETHGPFRNIHIKNITVKISNTAAIPAKCGINLSVVDGGSMENVLLENINMTGIKVPFSIRLGNRGRKYTDTASTPPVGFLRNVELRNITATATTNVTSSITGIPGYAAKNIRLKNIDITFPGGAPAVDSAFVVPENESAGPEATMFGDTLPSYGIFIRHVDSIQLCDVTFHPQLADNRPEYIFDDVAHVDTTWGCNISGLVNYQSESSSLAVYPNPFGWDNFNVVVDGDYRGGRIVISNLTGQQIQQLLITDKVTMVSAGNWPKGVYLITVEDSKHTRMNKMVVKQ